MRACSSPFSCVQAHALRARLYLPLTVIADGLPAVLEPGASIILNLYG